MRYYICKKHRFLFEAASLSHQNHSLARNRLFFDYLPNYLPRANLQGSSHPTILRAVDLKGSWIRFEGSSSSFREGFEPIKGSPNILHKTCALLSQALFSSVTRKVFIIRGR